MNANKPIDVPFNLKEMDTTRAALLFWKMHGPEQSSEFRKLATNYGQHEALTDQEISSLMDRLAEATAEI